MRVFLLALLASCGLDSFNTELGEDPDAPGFDSGLRTLDSGNDSNNRPKAHAGVDQTLYAGETADLDGSVSFDPDDDVLTYLWRLDSAPSGSNSSISGEDEVFASVYLDVPGDYEVSLEVSDGASSDTDSLILTAEPANTLPVADAGPDQSVPIGASVVLDGTGSTDPEDDLLNYTWRFKSKPNGSGASIAATGQGLAGFVADLEGNYLVELLVDDGVLVSKPDTVKVTANDGSSGGSSCNCGERARAEMRSNPWLFGIVILPQSFLGSVLFGVWATRRRTRSEQRGDN
jgi:hypothetical protein